MNTDHLFAVLALPTTTKKDRNTFFCFNVIIFLQFENKDYNYWKMRSKSFPLWAEAMFVFAAFSAVSIMGSFFFPKKSADPK